MHLILLCPIHAKLRRFWLPELTVGFSNSSQLSGVAHDVLVRFLCNSDNALDKARRLFHFLTNAIKMRNLYAELIEDAGVS